MTLGERQIFTQIDEPFTDDFLLADLNIGYDFGNVALTSITSYIYRDMLVVRDAGALTSSITGGSVGLPENVYTLDAPLDDLTNAKVWTQEVRLSGGKERVQWVAGGFYSNTKRDYAQHLLVAGFEALSGIPTTGTPRPHGRPLLLRPRLQPRPVRALRRGDLHRERPVQPDRRPSLLQLQRGQDPGLRRHLRQRQQRHSLGRQPGSTDANGVAPRFIASFKASENLNLNAQVSKGFRLGGINDPLNVPLCTAQRPRDVRRPRGLGGRDGVELRDRREVAAPAAAAASFNVSAFYMDISDLQAAVTAGTCSSRLIFNVPKARSVGAELEFAAAPTDNFDFAVTVGFNNSELRSTVTSTVPDGTVDRRVGHRGRGTVCRACPSSSRPPPPPTSGT